MVLLLTGASWLILGLIVGTLGYCPFTDWHFRVLEKLGESNLPYSYLKYLADRITGMDFSSEFVDRVTLYGFIIALGLSLYFNFRDLRGRRGEGEKGTKGRRDEGTKRQRDEGTKRQRDEETKRQRDKG